MLPESWTISKKAHLEYPGVRLAVLDGPSSGHQAVSLAKHFGAERIVLLGYDMMALRGKQQWHKPHVNAPQDQPYAEWIRAFDHMQLPLVVNCTRRTALKCFPRIALQDELALRSEPVT
jgi:hypothetical protein